jgi:phenylacetate-coenzyme A ligase PaaK-like adenylate-forming protein
MHTQLIKNVEGRRSDSIVLPDGRIFPPATFTLIPGEVTQHYGIDKIQQFQIIQHKKDEIEILIVINEKLRDVGPSVEKLLNGIKQRYQKLVGGDINIKVREVNKVKKDERSSTLPSSIVLSYVEHNDWI